MQMNEKQTMLAGAAALALIVFGALFWIAPVLPAWVPVQVQPAPAKQAADRQPGHNQTPLEN